MLMIDVAFTVDDARGIYRKAVDRGAKSIRAPWQGTINSSENQMAMELLSWLL